MKKTTKLGFWSLLFIFALPLVAFAEGDVGDAATATGLPSLGFALGAGIAIVGAMLRANVTHISSSGVTEPWPSSAVRPVRTASVSIA